MKISEAQIRRAAVGRVDVKNMSSILVALDRYGERFGLDRPHRLAQFFAQIMHESGDFRFDREIWGPTPAQVRYDTRTDLGNTPASDGDGYKNRGRGPIQVTGGYNIAEFYEWCVALGIGAVPDFRRDPDMINTDPWEGLSAIWYWDTRNLNHWADQGDIETITAKINGGKNGFADRVVRYGRLSLVLLGLAPDAVEQFQSSRGLGSDGDVGPKTRAAMHLALVALTPGEASRASIFAAPVTEDKPVVPVSVDKEVRQKTGWLTSIFGGGTGGIAALSWLNDVDTDKVMIIAGLGVAGVLIYLVAGEMIIRRVRKIRAATES